MSRKKMPIQWGSQRLIFANAQPEDAPALQAIYDACHYVRIWEGKGEERQDMLKTILEPELPPEGERQYVQLQLIRQASDGSVVGYVELYYGYPRPDILWVGIFYIHPRYQQQGVGSEAINAILHQIKQLGGYRQAQLAVGIKNWIGLRFWVSMGFNRLLRWKGDKVYAANAFAFSVLGTDDWVRE